MEGNSRFHIDSSLFLRNKFSGYVHIQTKFALYSSIFCHAKLCIRIVLTYRFLSTTVHLKHLLSRFGVNIFR